MDLNPYNVTPIAGPVEVTFAEDFRISLAYVDSTTGQTVADYTGENSVLVSELLSSMPAEALAQMVRELAPRMVEIAKGVTNV
jgi:hypothetical protein